MEDESGKTPAKSTGIGLLDNPQLYKLFVSVIDKRVNVEIRSRNENIRNWIIGVGVVLAGFAGLGVFAVNQFVSGAVNEKVNNAFEETVPHTVDQTVTSAVDKALKAFELDLNAIKIDAEIMDLNFYMLRFDSLDAFPTREAESIIQRIESLVQSVVSGKVPPQELGKLAYAVDTAVKNFAAAERLDLAKQVLDIVTQVDGHENLTSKFLNSDIVVQTMVMANGISLLGDAGAPSSWTEAAGLQGQAYRDYKSYVERARNIGYPELYLFFEILLGYTQQQNEEIITRLIDDVNDLNTEDTRNFASLMFSFAANQTKNEPDAASTRAAERVTRFLCEYGDRSDLLQGIMAQVILEGVEPRC